MHRVLRCSVLVAACLAFAGCAATGAAPASVGSVAANSPAAKLDGNDERALEDAEMRALESGATGAPTTWRNAASGHSGEITPGPAYRVNAYECRNYTSTVNLGGPPEISRKSACRQADGSWQPVT